VREVAGADGTLLRAGPGQPLFHVEHSVGGTELRPLNRWRIVHLTDAVDERLIERFERMAASPGWPSTPRSTFATTSASNSPEIHSTADSRSARPCTRDSSEKVTDRGRYG